MAGCVQVLPQAPTETALRALADAVLGGTLAAAESHGFSINAAREALAHGIGWVTLYGAISAWTLALVSFLVFGAKKAKQTEALPR